MAEDPELDPETKWQMALDEATYRYALTLKKLHESNPWPENSVLSQAINDLATELWDRYFSVTEITSALSDAAADLPRYAAGKEIRP